MNCNSTAFESPFEEQIYFSSTVQLVNNIQVCFLGIQSVFRILEPLQQSGAFNQFFSYFGSSTNIQQSSIKTCQQTQSVFLFFWIYKSIAGNV